MGIQLIVCPEHSFSVYLYLYIWVGGAIVFPLDSTVWGVQLIVCPEHSLSVYLYLYIWVGGAIVFPLDSTVWGYSLLCAQNIPSLYICIYTYG
ncbi:hypothetical protein XENTR_v10019959 [Xenopus tropicalis]|nr:hypothetical protein XENTR_v10019959 [Xenopus tropicalis]